ncbi:MAG: hypothetical protein ABIV50_02460, partial [Opitutus sp.]
VHSQREKGLHVLDVACAAMEKLGAGVGLVEYIGDVQIRVDLVRDAVLMSSVRLTIVYQRSDWWAL